MLLKTMTFSIELKLLTDPDKTKHLVGFVHQAQKPINEPLKPLTEATRDNTEPYRGHVKQFIRFFIKTIHKL